MSEQRASLISSRQLLFLSVSTCLLALGCGGKKEKEEEEPPPAPVRVVTAEKITLAEWTDLVGTTQPPPGNVARVTAAVEGRLLEPPGVREGQEVMAGQILARLDDRLVQANREKQQAVLREAEEQKVQAEAAVALVEIEVRRLEELNKTVPGGAPVSPAYRIDLEKARVNSKEAGARKRAA